MRQTTFLSGECVVYMLTVRIILTYGQGCPDKELRMRTSKLLSSAMFAMLAFATIPAVAQNANRTPTDLNSPAAHKMTTIVSPDGRIVHTPPRGQRSGGENVGGESGGS
jgi:hypothetical protein